MGKKARFVTIAVIIGAIALTWGLFFLLGNKNDAAQKAEVAQKFETIKGEEVEKDKIRKKVSQTMDVAAKVINEKKTAEDVMNEIEKRSVSPEVEKAMYYPSFFNDEQKRMAQFSLISLAETLEGRVGDKGFSLTSNTKISYDKDRGEARLFFDEVSGAPIPFSLKMVHTKRDGWLIDAGDIVEQVRINNLNISTLTK